MTRVDVPAGMSIDEVICNLAKQGAQEKQYIFEQKFITGNPAETMLELLKNQQYDEAKEYVFFAIETLAYFFEKFEMVNASEVNQEFVEEIFMCSSRILDWTELIATKDLSNDEELLLLGATTVLALHWKLNNIHIPE